MTKNTAPEPNHSVVARPNPGVEPDDDASTTSSLAAPGERLVIARRLGTATDEILELVRSALELAASEAEAGASLAELEAAVGGRVVALVDYLRVRPESSARLVFLSMEEPFGPLTRDTVSRLSRQAIIRTGIKVARPARGSLARVLDLGAIGGAVRSRRWGAAVRPAQGLAR